jgi:hypothetical protein
MKTFPTSRKRAPEAIANMLAKVVAGAETLGPCAGSYVYTFCGAAFNGARH